MRLSPLLVLGLGSLFAHADALTMSAGPSLTSKMLGSGSDHGKVAAFEAAMSDLYPARERRRVVGPKRKSLHSRASALEYTARVMDYYNEQFKQGDRSYFMNWNELSDLSDEEYRSFLRSRPLPSEHTKTLTITTTSTNSSTTTTSSSASSADLPASWNWLSIEGGKYVTPVKNQGTCGSCWAFSGVAVVESHFAIAHNTTAWPLSVEQVLSCSTSLDHIRSKFTINMTSSSEGCDGGMPFLTYEYMNQLSPHGITCASTYPYVMATNATSTTCRSVSSSSNAVAWTTGVSSYVAVDSKDEDALLEALLVGPISANIDASGDGFKNYGGGIYDANDCKSDGKEVNHAVVLVGFGETAAGDKYWVLRNTWGTMWGENGTMRMARGHKPNGPCNLYLYSSYPINMTAGNASTDGTCEVATGPFTALGAMEIFALEGMQWLLLIGVSLACLVTGTLSFWASERQLDQKEASDHIVKYEDHYARWVLPTREELAAALEQRHQQTVQV